jgi:restriction system protein
MLPVLRARGDGREHRTPDLVAQMADLFRLSEEERAALLPSGTQAVIANRTHWAITYMAQAGLLERTRRGFVRLTDRGREVLARTPERIDYDFLMEFPEFVAFMRRSRGDRPGGGSAESTDPSVTKVVGAARTPEERLRSAATELEAALRTELLDRIRKLAPDFFERAVVQLLLAMGYGSDLGAPRPRSAGAATADSTA